MLPGAHSALPGPPCRPRGSRARPVCHLGPCSRVGALPPWGTTPPRPAGREGPGAGGVCSGQVPHLVLLLLDSLRVFMQSAPAPGGPIGAQSALSIPVSRPLPQSVRGWGLAERKLSGSWGRGATSQGPRGGGGAVPGRPSPLATGAAVRLYLEGAAAIALEPRTRTRLSGRAPRTHSHTHVRTHTRVGRQVRNFVGRTPRRPA